MKTVSVTVPPCWDGAMAKRFLRGYYGLSHRLLVSLKAAPMGITMDGSLLRAIDPVRAGSVITLRLPEDQRRPAPVELPLQVVYEDGDLLIVNKTPFLPVHPVHGHLDDTLANAVAAYLGPKGEACAFRPIYRLDRDTSGLLVAAKHSYAASRLAKGIGKSYYAVIQGELEGNGKIDAPIRRREGFGIQREVGEGGVPAVTHWEALGSGRGHTLLRVKLETGRTHQIRVHFSSLHMPLAGDDMYGGARQWIFRQALHCGEVRFQHPVTNAPVALRCPFPQDFLQLLDFCDIPAEMDTQPAPDG